MQKHRELLQKIFPFWETLSKDEQNELLFSTFEKKFSRGAQVKSQHSSCLGAMYVIDGRLRAYITSDEGKEITLYYIDSAEICILTANCVIPPISFEIQIEAIEDSEIIHIAPTAFGKVQSHNLVVENFALKTIAERFSDVIWSIEQFHSFSVPTRIAMFMYDEALRVQGDTLKVTHEQIAKALASAREVVSRQLKVYEEEKIIEIGRGRIKILDMNALKKIIFLSN